MAVIKVTKGGRSLGDALRYVEKKAEIVSGLDCSDDRKQALQDMKNTKELYGKIEGRQYKSYVQSFSPKEITAEQAHKIGQEWAEKNFVGFEVYIATHTDKNHIHNHFIVNSVSWENGKKLHEGKKELLNQKKSNDVICEKHGLSIPEKKQDNEFRSFNQNKYQLFKRIENGEKVKSYIINTALAIEKSTEFATDRESFIKLMGEQGYLVDWKDTHKHVTFKDQDGNKVRLANLQKTFNENKFSKEKLENEFTKPKEQDRGTKLNTQGTVNRIEQTKQNGIREQPAQRELNRIHSTIRGLEEGAKQYSPTAREESRKLEFEQRAKAERIERERKQAEEHKRATQQQHKSVARKQHSRSYEGPSR